MPALPSLSGVAVGTILLFAGVSVIVFDLCADFFLTEFWHEPYFLSFRVLELFYSLLYVQFAGFLAHVVGQFLCFPILGRKTSLATYLLSILPASAALALQSLMLFAPRAFLEIHSTLGLANLPLLTTWLLTLTTGMMLVSLQTWHRSVGSDRDAHRAGVAFWVTLALLAALVGLNHLCMEAARRPAYRSEGRWGGMELQHIFSVGLVVFGVVWLAFYGNVLIHMYRTLRECPVPRKAVADA